MSWVLDVMQALEFLSSNAYRDEVENLIRELQEQGVTGVPHTVVNDHWAIVGGQMSDIYYKVRRGLVDIS